VFSLAISHVFQTFATCHCRAHHLAVRARGQAVSSLLMSNAVVRIAGAFIAVALLWLGVAWALN